MTPPGTGDANDQGLPGPGGVFLDQYVLLELLSDSRRGAIYKAKHRTMGRTVAIKFLSDEAARSKQFTERFHRASKILALLEHPNLVRAHEATCQGTTNYLVLEYVDGQDLHKLIKTEGEMPVERALRYVMQAAAGLAYAHDQGVVHRNIKPGKLVLDKKDTIKIVGFGLAQIDKEGAIGQEDDAESLTIQGQVLGSYEYMAPEQAANAKKADQRSDIYSLGCTLHALLTGRPPYEGKGPTMQIVAHSSQPIPSLRKLRGDVPEPLDRVFAKMLAKQPDDRFAAMSDVIREIEPLLSLATSAKATPAAKAAVPGESPTKSQRSQPSKAAPTPPPAPAASPQSKLLVGLAGGAVVALALFLLIVFGLPSGEPEGDAKPPAAKPREVAQVAPPLAKPTDPPKLTPSVTPPVREKQDPRARPSGPRTLENVLASAPTTVPSTGPVQEPPAAKPPAEPTPPTSVPTPPPTPEPATPPEEPASQPEPSEQEKPTVTAADARHAVPSEKAQQRASQLLKETFEEEIAKAITPTAKSDIGKQLLAMAADINDDPASRYVILDTVLGLAMDAGDLPVGLDSIDAMAGFFAIDAWSKKVEWIAACADVAKNAEQRRLAATKAFELAKEADAASQFEIAEKLCKLAATEGKKAAPFPLMKQVRLLDADVTKRLAAFKDYEKALQKLAANAADHQANLAAGRYECFVVGNWTAGLAKLAASGDADLDPLATKELAAPSVPEQQIEVADGWHVLAEKESGSTAASLHRHAADWYEKAVPNATGLLKAKAERRLDESRAAAAATP